MRDRYLIIAVLTASFALVGGCPNAGDIYTPKELVKVLKKDGWAPLLIPDSKYLPGTIIKVTDDGIRWVSQLETCRYPAEALGIKKGHVPNITFTKATQWDANAIVNIKGITAGPGFDRISKVDLTIKDQRAEALDILKLKIWSEVPANRAKVSSACMQELEKPDYFLVTEVFRVSEGVYTLYDKSGAAIEISTPVLGDLLKFEPNVKYSIEANGSLVIDQPTTFAVRRVARVGNDFEVLSRAVAGPETADAKIESLFLKAAGK
jgi:hypothetical protein